MKGGGGVNLSAPVTITPWLLTYLIQIKPTTCAIHPTQSRICVLEKRQVERRTKFAFKNEYDIQIHRTIKN